MEIQRQLQLAPLLAKKSFFLFGPRATGKTTLVRQQLKYLMEEGVFQKFILVSQDPVASLTDGILTVSWQKFLSDLWQDKFV